MKPLRKRLDADARATGLRLDTIQQDYILTWLLDGIGQHALLHNSLVFKGGTALKKCYFGRYRFSEDLDFTATDSSPQGGRLQNAVEEVCSTVEVAISTYAPITLHCERYVEREPHPHGQEAFTIRTQFPWQREPLTKVMIEVSRDEALLFSPVARPIIHNYEEAISGSIRTYTLNEVVLEKLRAILQHTRKLHERDWNRSRARDYYDLWHILCHSDRLMQIKKAAALLRKKCTGKGVTFSDTDDIFQPIMIANVRQTWEQWLGPLVEDLPPVERVLEELRPAIDSLLKESRPELVQL